MTRKITLGLSRYIGIALIAIALLGLASCKKSTTSTSNNNTATTNASATVDGYSFKGTFGVVVAAPYYTEIFGVDVNNGTSAFKELLIYVPGTPAVQTYTLGVNNGTTNGWGWYFAGTSAASYTGYYTDSTNTGTLTISKYDVANKLISGSFSFKAKQYYPATGTGTVNVTSGAFTDVKWQ